MERISRHFQNSRRVLVTSHTNPDGDAIGSLLAMGLCMGKLSKSVCFYNESKIPAVYQFLPAVDRVTHHVDDFQAFDTAVVLDCGDIRRTGRLFKRIARIPMVVNIDHHVTNTGFGKLNWVDTAACASAAMVYALINALHIEIDIAMATAIYTGILTDTGSFRFSNTNRAAFQICEEMISRGVNASTVARHVYGTYSMGRIKLLNLALDSIEISKNGKLSLMTLTQDMLSETGTEPEDIDGLIHYAKRIQDVKLAVLLHEQKSRGNGYDMARPFHVSLRSDGSIDVAAIAASFGGGGHCNAAGFVIESTLSDLKNRMIRLTDSM